MPNNRFAQFRSPIQGRLVQLEQVPDPVFAGKIMGEGFAIEPQTGDVTPAGTEVSPAAPRSVNEATAPAALPADIAVPYDGTTSASATITFNVQFSGAPVGTDAEKNLLLVRGAVPGPKGGTVVVRDAVKATQDEAGWARVAAVGTHIGNKLSFDARNYGYASLTKLMAATQVFELRDEGTARVAVRDLRGHQDEVLP